MVPWLCRNSSSSNGLSNSLTKNKCPFLWLLSFFVQFYISAANTVHDFAQIQFTPNYIYNLLEGNNTTVNVKLKFDENEFVTSPFFNKSLRISVKTLHPEVATSDISIFGIDPSDLKAINDTLEYDFNTKITSHFMGKTALQVRLISVDVGNNGNAEIEFMELASEEAQAFSSELKPVKGASRMDLWVKREEEYDLFTKIFVVTLIFLMIFANILMGCELDLGSVLSTIKSLAGPSIGCLTQFVMMPLIAYTISNVVLLPLGLNSFALGLFVTGCSPGGGASNFWTILLEGNVNLSITMTFISTVASIFFIPFWMNVLGHRFLQGSTDAVQIKVPYLNIVSALLILIVPLLIGIGIAKFLPSIAAGARKILRPFIVCVLLFVIIFGTVINFHLIHVLTWPALISGALLPSSGFIVGCFISLILGQKYENITAISVETGVQNTGIAIMLLKISFTSPDADISALMPVIVACFTLFPLLIVLGIRTAFTKWRNNKKIPYVERDASMYMGIVTPLNDSTDSNNDGNFSFLLIPGY